MATMATFPPIHHPHDLPICPLPTDIYNDHDNYHLWSLLNPFEDEFTSYPLDLSILSDITDEPSGVDQLYPPPTDLVEMEVNPFQTPPTPEPEPDFIQKPEEIHGMSSQPQNDPSFCISSLTEGIKMEKKDIESPCPMEIQREEPKVSSESERMENNELEHKQIPLPQDNYTLVKTEEEQEEERPARRCHSRYALRNNVGGASIKLSRPTVRKTVVLWKFLEELLDKGEENCVSWVSREEGTFKFVDSKLAAKFWGQRKNKRNMTYEKLSRALRYYYDRGIMFHEEGQKLIYRFGEVVMKNRRPSTE